MPKALAAAVIEKNGKILLVQEGEQDSYKQWNLPTGHVEEDEDVFSAALREVREETGLNVEITGLLGIYEYFKKDENKLRFTFCAKVKSGKESPGKDILWLQWFTKEEISKMPESKFRNRYIKDMVNDYFSGKRYEKEIIKFLGEDRK